jgi:Flp pilus assembly protein TadG
MTERAIFPRLTALRRCRRASVMVEVGLIAPVVGILAVGLFEYTAATYQGMQMRSAARAGMEYAMKFPSDTAGIQQAVVGAGQVSATDLTVTVTQFAECPDGTPAATTDTCADGKLSNVFLRLALAQPAKSILTSSNLIDGYSVGASTVMRVR